VVHISSGVSALVAALVLGRRRIHPTEPITPHNLTLTLLGAGLLWFGWFGFNAGSALASGQLSVVAFVATHTAAAAATVAWMLVEWLLRGKPTVLGAATGAVAGLVAVTPAAGFVSPLSALLIGIGVGVLCYFAVSWKNRLGYDDSLDAFGVHGVGGTWGALATGLFASQAINAAGKNGLFYGNPAQLGVQALGVLATIVYAVVVTFVLLKVVDALMGLRVSEEQESEGLDLSQHGEAAYSW
jgi:Amt family ammonium transporter